MTPLDAQRAVAATRNRWDRVRLTAPAEAAARIETLRARRCWCGRPINHDDAYECGEHDDTWRGELTAPQPQPYPADVIPRAVVHPPLFQVSRHCTFDGCLSTDCVTADGVHGRRCAAHPPTFEPLYAVHLAVRMGPEAAFTYCRTEGLAS